MNHAPFLRGVGIGIAVGAAVSMAMMPRKKMTPMKKKACRALHAVEDAVENISSAIGL